MAVNWLEVAKKVAEDARAQLALNRKRLQEILAERANSPPKDLTRMPGDPASPDDHSSAALIPC